MLDFLIIILIFFEIALCYIAITKIPELNRKIIKLNEVVVEKGRIIDDIHKKIQIITKRVNFFISVITNKKIWQIKKIISSIISVVEILIILRSFNFQKGVKFNLKNVKKLLFTGLSKQIIKKLIDCVNFAC